MVGETISPLPCNVCVPVKYKPGSVPKFEANPNVTLPFTVKPFTTVTIAFKFVTASLFESIVTPFSVPNIFVLVLGGGSAMLRVVTLAALALAGVALWRNRDWLSGAGWATLALLGALVWLTPWYIAWVLPLAAIAGSRRLRQAALAGTVFLLLSFLPALPIAVDRFALNTSVGHASQARQGLLSQ